MGFDVLFFGILGVFGLLLLLGMAMTVAFRLPELAELQQLNEDLAAENEDLWDTVQDMHVELDQDRDPLPTEIDLYHVQTYN